MQVVVNKSVENVPRLSSSCFSIALERLVMKNIFKPGEKVNVYVNDTGHAVYTFEAPGEQLIEEVPDVLVYAYRSPNRNGEMKISFSRHVEDGSFEAVFRVERVMSTEDETPNVEYVALVHFETKGKKLAAGKRFFVRLSGVSSVFYASGNSYQSAIYSFVGKNAEANETPVHHMYFPYIPGLQMVHVSNSNGNSIVFDSSQYFKVVLSIRKMGRTDIVELNIGCNPIVHEIHAPFVDSAVIVTRELEIYPKIGLRTIFNTNHSIDPYEVALVRLETSSGTFEPHSRIVLEILDTDQSRPVVYVTSKQYPLGVYSCVANDDGAIDIEEKCPLYHRSLNNAAMYVFTLRFRHHPSGRVVDVTDGSFEAMFHTRALRKSITETG